LNNNGSVSLEEITERRGDVFFMFDQDKNEVITAEKYALFDETRAADMENNAGGHGQGGGSMQEGLTLAFNDNNANGEVSKAEFSTNSAAWFTQIDRDGDGMITTADFGPKG
jgi:Ca2+-binding EF-hand superfamily protein